MQSYTCGQLLSSLGTAFRVTSGDGLEERLTQGDQAPDGGERHEGVKIESGLPRKICDRRTDHGGEL